MLKQGDVFKHQKKVFFFLPNHTAFIIGCNNITVTKVIHKYFGSSETMNPKPVVFRDAVCRKMVPSQLD